jgi:hypothetical protein
MGRVFRLPAPTLAWALAALAPVLIFVATALSRAYQTDLWHHLARGRAIVSQGRLINEDLFSCTVHGQPLQDANWLTQIVYYGLYSAGGLDLIQLVNSLTLAAVLGLVVFACWRASMSLRLAALVSVFTFLGIWQLLVIRPQTFSFLLFMLIYVALDLAGRRPWLLVVPPLILALWVNVHGGFPIGFILIGAFLLAAAWEAVRAKGWGLLHDGRTWGLAVCLAASVLATLANPYGWRVYQYVGVTSQRAVSRQILEWLAPGTGLFISRMFVASVLLVLVTFGLSPRRPAPRDVVLAVCFFPFAAGALRMIAWWMLVIAPAVAAQLAAAVPPAWLDETDDRRPSPAGTLAVGVLAVLAVLAVPGLGRVVPMGDFNNPVHPEETDLQVVSDQIRRDHPEPACIFASFEWGEYLEWALAPAGYRVFVDGRIEIYPDDVWADYEAITRGRADWQQILDRYGVDCLVLNNSYPEQHDLLMPLVRRSEAWTARKPFEQGKAVVFVRGAQPATAKR